jgi:hypothetical protein
LQIKQRREDSERRSGKALFPAQEEPPLPCQPTGIAVEEGTRLFRSELLKVTMSRRNLRPPASPLGFRIALVLAPFIVIAIVIMLMRLR